jgi:hypothetical protein
MKTLKNTFIVMSICIASTMSLKAQEGYDLMHVYYEPLKSKIHLVQNDVPTKEIDTLKNEKVEKILSVVSKLTTEGWEIVNINDSFSFTLKRKKQ